MITRWISDVPSKMVKLVDVREAPQVYALSTVALSARTQHGCRGLPDPSPAVFLPARLPSGRTGLSPDFEGLRWFPLPPGCLSQIPGQPAATPTD
jgi:hypothetical protein